MTRYRDLEALVVVLRAGVTPDEPYVNRHSPWPCTCNECGRTVKPRLADVQRGGAACAYCAGRRIDVDYAMRIMRDKGVEPLVPYPGQGTPWKSQCLSCKRIVTPTLGNVRQQINGCAYCAGRRVDPHSARLLMEASNLHPLTEYPGSGRPWPCKCLVCGNSVRPTYNTIQQGKGGCGWCSGRVRDQEAIIELMRQAGVDPLEPYPGNDQPWTSRCLKCGKDVTPMLKTVRRGTPACSYCAKRKVDPTDAFNMMIKAGVSPLTPYPGSQEPWPSQCLRCGRNVTPQYASVRMGRDGCGWCQGQFIDPLKAADFMRERGWEPLVEYPGSDVPWTCRCRKCGTEATPRYHSLKKTKGNGCLRCRGHLSAKDATLLMRNHGLEPLTDYPGKNRAWPCICTKCHREVAPALASVSRGSAPCRYCAGLTVDPQEAAELMRLAGVEPLEPYPGGNKKPWRARCNTCGRTVTPQYQSIRQGRHGCRWCASPRAASHAT